MKKKRSRIKNKIKSGKTPNKRNNVRKNSKKRATRKIPVKRPVIPDRVIPNKVGVVLIIIVLIFSVLSTLSVMNILYSPSESSARDIGAASTSGEVSLEFIAPSDFYDEEIGEVSLEITP